MPFMLLLSGFRSISLDRALLCVLLGRSVVVSVLNCLSLSACCVSSRDETKKGGQKKENVARLMPPATEAEILKFLSAFVGGVVIIFYASTPILTTIE